MYKFTSLYSVISKVSLAAGFYFPAASQLHTKFSRILLLNCIASNIPSFYNVACNLIFNFTLDPYDTRRHGFTMVSIVNVFDTFYYIIRFEEFNCLLKKFDNITQNIIDSDFVTNSDVKYILNTAKKFNSYIKYYVILETLVIMCPVIITYVSRYFIAQDFLFLKVPYSLKSEFIFNITMFLQMSTVLYAFFKLVCSWSVIFLLLYHITFYLKTLGNCFESFDSVDETQQQHNLNLISESHNIRRLRSWLELHQEILRFISKFNRLYSPLLLIHLLHFHASSLCYISSITMQKVSLITSLLLLSFVTSQMVVFLFLCKIGNELTYQSGKVFQKWYYIIHLSADKAVSNCGLIAGEVTNKPIIVSVFGSEYFNLTLDAFIWMVKSMASFYVGLTQIQKLNENYDRG